MIKCKECGKLTGPAFGKCSDCIRKEDKKDASYTVLGKSSPMSPPEPVRIMKIERISK